MKKIFFILFLFVNSLYANEFNNEFNFDEDFNSFLQDESEIATKSKLNIDYAPSIITILKGETLEKLGAKDLFEALSFIPSIDINRAKYGVEKLNIRGIVGLDARGQYKFLINSIPITQLLSHDIFLYIPIEHIKQIEVIRGPSSTIYGENAFSGVINVVTKKDENRLFFKDEFYEKGRNGELTGVSLFKQIDDFKINILASKNENDGDKIVSNGMVLENIEDKESLLIDINYKNTHFTFMNSLQKYGDFYGIYNIPFNDGKENLFRKNFLASLTHKFEISENIHLNLSAHYLASQNRLDDIALFKFFNNNSFEKLGLNVFYKEKQEFVNLDFHYKLDNHNFLLGLYLRDSKKDKMSQELLINPSILPFLASSPEFNQLFSAPPSDNDIMFSDIKRENRAIYLQDIYKLNDKFSLTLGIRSDKYSDIDNSFVPKVAGVYEIDRENILKAQFAKAFRPPSFFEQYDFSSPYKKPKEKLKSEVINTYELAYINNKRDSTFRTNLFYSKLNNLIFPNEKGLYINLAKAESKGIEFEFIKNYGENLILNSNMSYTTIDYENLNFSQIDNLMVNLALFIKPYSTNTLSLWYKYLREDIKEYGVRDHHNIDMNFEKTMIVDSNIFTTKVGIKNIFNAKYNYFDFENRGIIANGRSLWVGISYEF